MVAPSSQMGSLMKRGKMNKQNHVFRKGLASIALAALLVTPLAACGSDGAVDDSSETQTITVWHYYSVDGQTETLDELAEDFESTHDGVTVENVYIPQDQIVSKIVNSAGSGTGPDVIIYGAASTATLAEAGAIISLDDYWSDFEDADQFPDAAIQRVDDTIYGVQGFLNVLGLWYNQDILDEIGVEPPTTIDELEDAMAKAVDAGYQGVTLAGISNTADSQFQAFPWFSNYGFTYEDPQVEPFVETFEMVQRWTENGWLSQEAAVWDQTVPFQNFEAGDVAFCENGNWQITSAENDADFNYGVVPLPIDSETGGSLLGGENISIGAYSEKQELALEYVADEFWSVDGELALLDGFGSIPARADAADNETISSDPILSQFAKVVSEQGFPSPSPYVPASNVNEVELLVGQYWSEAIAGDDTPENLANDLIDEMKPLLEE